MTHNHVHIGTGKFGLGMVIDVCATAGLESVGLNRASYKAHHRSLKEKGYYKIVYDSDYSKPRRIDVNFDFYQDSQDYRAIELLSAPSVALITTSVTADGLTEIAPLLAGALERRSENSAGPLCIIACENLQHNSMGLSELVRRHISPKGQAYFRDSVFFCNSVVDRICFELKPSSECTVVGVESFVEWIVQEPATGLTILDKLEKVPGFKRASNSAEFEVMETRKSWCFNGVHLAAAAFAFNYALDTDKAIVTLAEALQHPEVISKVRALQEELGFALRCVARKKNVIEVFSNDEIEQYNARILHRMQANSEDRIARILKHAEAPVQSVRDVLRTFDLHELLDRVVRRIIAPQQEILSTCDQLAQSARELWPSIDLPNDPDPTRALNLALREIVIAAQRYAQQAYEDARKANLID